MHRRALLVLSGSILLAGVLPAGASAYSLDTYNGHSTQEAPENVACVSASAVTHINYITGGTNYTHALAMSWYNEVRSGDHNFYKYQNWDEDGLDPRGWAWLLWKKSPGNYGFNDYRYVTKGQADSNMMAGIRATLQPVGAIVFAGLHAVDVVGFQATADPLEQPVTLQGFWIVDPYYGGGNVKHHPINPKTGTPFTGWIGWAPNSFIQISTWDNSYLLPYTDKIFSANHGGDVTMWDNRYVVVLRAVDGSPEPSNSVPGPPPGATATYASTFTGSLAMASAEGVTAAESPAYPDDELDRAVLDGIASNGLSDDPHVGVTLKNIRIGRRAHVDSLVDSFPSYELVEIKSDGKVVAIAMATDHPDGLRFAGLQPVYEGNRLRTAREVKADFTTRGQHTKTLRMVWGPSDQSMAPFSPMWEATDSSGHHQFMAPDGTTSATYKPARASVSVGAN